MMKSLLSLIRNTFGTEATIEAVDAEMRLRRGRDREQKRATKHGATHQHRAPGKGLHRRAYLPQAHVRTFKRAMQRGA